MLQNLNSNFFDIFSIDKNIKSFNQVDIGSNNFNALRQIRKIINKKIFLLQFETKLEFNNFGLSINLIHKAEKDFKKYFKSFIKQMIETIDGQILNLNNQKQFKWINKGFAKKTIYLKTYGKIDFWIRRYKIKDLNLPYDFYPVLHILNISDDMLLYGQKEEILAEYTQIKSVRKLARRYQMSKDKIHRIIQNTEVKFIPQVITNKATTLFINLDGFWIRNNCKSIHQISEYVQNSEKTKREIHSACLFTLSGKNELTNKFTYWFNEKRTLKENIEELKSMIKIMYPNCHNLIVVGDGAKWIKNTAIELNAKYVMDKFHYMKILVDNFTKLVGGKKESMNIIKKYKSIFYQSINNNESFSKVIKTILNEHKYNYGEIISDEKINKIFNYNYVYFDDFCSSYKNKYISVIEAEQSRCVGNYLRYARSSFGIKTAEKIRMFALSFYNKMKVVINNWTRLDFVYKSCNNNLFDNKWFNINCEVNDLPNRKDISPRGWVTKKYKSNY